MWNFMPKNLISFVTFNRSTHFFYIVYKEFKIDYFEN